MAELIKREIDTIDYKIGDVTFKIKKNATQEDCMTIAFLCADKDNCAVFKKLVKLFVLGWSGVTENGHEIPYSYDLLANRFPVIDGKNILTELGVFIWQNTDIDRTPKGQESDLKKA